MKLISSNGNEILLDSTATHELGELYNDEVDDYYSIMYSTVNGSELLKNSWTKTYKDFIFKSEYNVTIDFKYVVKNNYQEF